MSSTKPVLDRGSLSPHPEKFRRTRLHHPPKGSIAAQRIKAITGGPLTKSLTMRHLGQKQIQPLSEQQKYPPPHSDEEETMDLMDAFEGGHLDFISGTIGGMAGVIAGQPFDLVKIKIQTDPAYSPNVWKSFRRILHQEGVIGLYKGLLSPLLGVGAINAIVFGVYGNFTRLAAAYEGLDPEEDDAPYHMVFMGGCLGGLANCVVVTPVELVKTQLQVQESKSGRRYTSMTDCYRQLYRAGGVSALFKGMVPSIWREVPSYGVYFASFEMLRRWWGDSTLSIFMAGGMGGVFAWVTSYPFDVVKSRLQALPPKGQPGWDRYKGALHCTRELYRQEGGQVFWRGLGACIVRSFPVNAVTFLFASKSRDWLEEQGW